ncbi:MAG: hypothetical protein ACYS18_11870 [Planctomycetota bacterium]|jgi:hypothetical protein
MNKAQKIAWCNLAVLIAGAVLVTVLAIIGAFKSALVASLGIVVLVGILPLFFRKKRGHVDFDERDQLIRLRALFFASSVSFWLLIVQCVLQIFKVGPRGSVPVGTLVGTVYGALVAFVIAKSLWTLIEYRYGKK